MTPKMTKDSHMLLEQSGDLWLSHRFHHEANCKLKASLTLIMRNKMQKKTNKQTNKQRLLYVYLENSPKKARALIG